MTIPRRTYRGRPGETAEDWQSIVKGTPEAEEWLDEFFHANYINTSSVKGTKLDRVGALGMKELLVKVMMHVINAMPRER